MQRRHVVGLRLMCGVVRLLWINKRTWRRTILAYMLYERDVSNGKFLYAYISLL